MDYISIEELISEVELNLSSYFQSGSVDSSIFYGKVKRCLSEIGVKILPKKSDILYVNNYTVDLPSDYNSLILLMSCETKGYLVNDNPALITYEQAVCDIPICHTENMYGHNEFGRYQVYQRVNHEFLVHNVIKVLTLGHEHNSCVNPTNIKKYDVEIKNNKIYTQFESGTLYIDYRAVLEKDSEILIPDVDRIKEWLILEMERAAMKYLYFNTTSDVGQRLQYSDRELHIAKENARALWKLNSQKDFNNLKKALQDRFTIQSRIS
jgi:hypothetical protein